jgi:hypothetical protein
VVSVGVEEGLGGGVAEGEVEVDPEGATDDRQHQHLEGEDGAVGGHLVLEGREQVAVPAVEHQRPDRQNHQVLHVVQRELKQTDLLEVRPGNSAEGTQQPRSPSGVQPPHPQARVILRP